MSITSANSSLVLGVTNLITPAQQMVGFAADDAYELDPIDPTEAVMGVDAHMSSGWIPQIKVMHVTLQADSPSIPFFEQWYSAQEQAQDIYTGFGTVYQPSVGLSYSLNNGVLANYTPLAGAKKILAPRRFQIKWEAVYANGPA